MHTMQEQLLHAAEPGRRPAQQFAGVDLRRPKGYASNPPVDPAVSAKATGGAAEGGEPCPRCESRDTKFCYYNNYNTSQPRHFCKGCRRYWTKGGTLRSVPVGGGTRKRPSSSSSGAVKQKKPSKKRRVAPPESAVDDVTATGPDAAAKTTTDTATATTPPADAASEITTELVVPAATAAAAAEEDSFTDLLQQGDDAVALDLGFSDFPAGGKALGDAYAFEWPPAFDLGACWSGTGFGADPDPAVFMNLP